MLLNSHSTSAAHGVHESLSKTVSEDIIRQHKPPGAPSTTMELAQKEKKKRGSAIEAEA